MRTIETTGIIGRLIKKFQFENDLIDFEEDLLAKEYSFLTKTKLVLKGVYEEFIR